MIALVTSPSGCEWQLFGSVEIFSKFTTSIMILHAETSLLIILRWTTHHQLNAHEGVCKYAHFVSPSANLFSDHVQTLNSCAYFASETWLRATHQPLLSCKITCVFHFSRTPTSIHDLDLYIPLCQVVELTHVWSKDFLARIREVSVSKSLILNYFL